MDLNTERGFAQACRWTQDQLTLLADGGVWVIPRSGSIVRVTSHKTKTAVLRGAEREPVVEAILLTLGWKLTKEK